MKTSKRLVIGGVVLALGAAAVAGAQYANAAEAKVAAFKPVAGRIPTAPVPVGGVQPGWKLVWQPNLSQAGLKAFEGVEDDRGHGDPSHQHIGMNGADVEFDMNMKVKDSLSGRQRIEVKGMRTDNGTMLEMNKGETWRITYDMYIPSSLEATTSFTHIMQFKMPGAGSSPIMTTSLRRVGNTPMIEENLFGQSVFARTPLAPLQNKWITATVEITIGDKTSGAAAYTITAGGTTVVHAQKSNVDTFIADRVRPKWGIYRSFDDKSHLQDCYLLLANMRAYKKA